MKNKSYTIEKYGWMGKCIPLSRIIEDKVKDLDVLRVYLTNERGGKNKWTSGDYPPKKVKVTVTVEEVEEGLTCRTCGKPITDPICRIYIDGTAEHMECVVKKKKIEPITVPRWDICHREITQIIEKINEIIERVNGDES